MVYVSILSVRVTTDGLIFLFLHWAYMMVFFSSRSTSYSPVGLSDGYPVIAVSSNVEALLYIFLVEQKTVSRLVSTTLNESSFL
jgi:hypothetical protein